MAELVAGFNGRGHGAGAAGGGLTPGLAGVVHFESNGADAVAVAGDVLGDGAAGAQRGGEHEANLALLDDIRGAVMLAGLRAGVGDQAHAEGGAVEVGGLAGVAHVELHVISAFEGQKIFAGGDGAGSKRCHADLRDRRGAAIAGSRSHLRTRIGCFVEDFEGRLEGNRRGLAFFVLSYGLLA